MYKLINSLDDIPVIDSTKPLFCDTETDGLYGRIELLQLMQEGWDEAILVRRPDPLLTAVFLAKYNTVWHNAHYDITTVQQQTKSTWVPEQYEDTFLLARLAYPNKEAFSLDACLDYALGYDPYEEANLDKKVLQKSDWSAIHLSKDQLTYAAIDVFYMPFLWDAVKTKVDDMNYKLDKLTLGYCWGFQWRGMPVDNAKLNTKWDKIEDELSTIDMPINANSWQQVRTWLNVDQSDDKFLATLEIKGGNDKAARVRKVRKLNKLISFLKKFDLDDNRILGKFKPSTRSGRLSSDDQNLQQLPRALKGIFGYNEDDGRILIYSDYAQLELRTICAILGVKVMEKLFRDNEDLHGYVASILFGADYTKADRQVTKTYNFNLLYGGSVGMVLSILIGYGFLIEERVANKHKTKWLNLFTEINKWQQEQISAWRKGKLSSTPLGRQYKGKLMTDQMNIKNQGAGAEVAKLALHYFAPWLKKYNEANDCDFGICNFIHDSFILDGPNDPELYKPVATQLAECMQEAWFEMSKLYKVKDLPMPVDVAVGYNWGDIEDDAEDLWNFTLDPYKMLEQANA